MSPEKENPQFPDKELQPSVEGVLPGISEQGERVTGEDFGEEEAPFVPDLDTGITAEPLLEPGRKLQVMGRPAPLFDGTGALSSLQGQFEALGSTNSRAAHRATRGLQEIKKQVDKTR